jgi:hypothetical protein
MFFQRRLSSTSLSLLLLVMYKQGDTRNDLQKVRSMLHDECLTTRYDLAAWWCVVLLYMQACRCITFSVSPHDSSSEKQKEREQQAVVQQLHVVQRDRRMSDCAFQCSQI